MFIIIVLLLSDSTVLYPIENNKSLIQLQESLENILNTSLTKLYVFQIVQYYTL